MKPVSKRKLFLVVGSCGEYDDYCEWVVCAYENEGRALEHAKMAEKVVKDLVNKYESYRDVPHGANPLDPSMLIDYTGTWYEVEETTLYE